MVAAFHVEAKLHGFRRTQDGVVVSFVLSPIDVPKQLALDPLGTRYMLALAEIGDDEQPVTDKTAPEHKAPPPARSMAAHERYANGTPQEQAVVRAALLAKDPEFQKWVSPIRYPHVTEEDAAMFIRHECKVYSRGAIAEYESAYNAFIELENRFLAESGRIAEKRA